MGMPIGEYIQLPKRNGKPLVDKNRIMACDSAKESMIIDLAKSGINAVPALKGPGSVFRTISSMQSYNIVYTKSSENLKSEYLEYSWKIDRYGLSEDTPAPGQQDHALQASGYIISFMITYLGIGSV